MSHDKVIFTEAQVSKRIGEMAAEIAGRYDPKSTLFVSLLNGAVPFTVQLMKAICDHDPDFHPNVQYMKVSRYGDSRQGGKLQVISDLSPPYRDLSDRHIIVLDDLWDEGGTLRFTKKHLLGYGAASVDCVALIKKIKNPPVEDDLALYGFEGPDVWLTGMGMDNANVAPEANRWAPWIAIAD